MTINEAYKIILNNLNNKDDIQEAIKVIDNLVDFSNPKKVKFEVEEIGDREAFGGTGYMQYGVCICPNCEEQLDSDEHYDYCPVCGQSLKWPVED